MRVEQRSQLAAMQQLESRSDEELEAETKFKAAAQAILGARAAERYDAKAARAHFQRAIAAARPQERLQLRRMADASLALAERRPDDLKKATERLGVEAPTNRQLRGLQFMGLIAPPKSAGMLARIRGIVIIIVLVVAVLALGFGIVNLIALPFGGISLDLGIFYGFVLVAIALGVLAFLGRRRQKRAQAERARADRGAVALKAPDAPCAAGTRSPRLTRPPSGRDFRSASRSRSGAATTSPRATRCWPSPPTARAIRAASCCGGGSSRRGPRRRTPG